MPDETCRCEVLDATTEGGGMDPRSCPDHAYEAGRRHERACYVDERTKAREVYAAQLHRLQDEAAALAGDVEGLRETLKGIGAIVGVTKDSPVGERSVTVAVHALMCRARDVVACFKKVGDTGSLYLEAPGTQPEQAILELRKLTEKAV